jgi:6-phospho-beta-glucosidase
MTPFTVGIIGAGSSYTPELIERLVQMRSALPVTELILMDIDPARLDIMAGFCRRFLRHLGHEIPIRTTTDRREAIAPSRFLIVQIRVGGNAQRIQDEKIPLKYGIIGQETTGPGGMFKGLRTIPAILDIARDVERLNPAAWIINYANPTGLNAEAALKHTRANFVGLCSGGLFPRWFVSDALGVPQESVFYSYFGLNHFNFAYDLTVNGRPLTDAEFDRVADKATWGQVAPDLIRVLRLIPSPYLQYFYHRARGVKQAQAKAHTRGEEVQEIEKELFAQYADPAQVSKPAALAKRGGGGYSEIALGVMDAIYNNRERVMVVGTTNRGAVDRLPDDAVLEIPCVVNAAGIFPVRQPKVPDSVWGLVAAVKNYEQLAVDAAVTGSRRKALEALLAHPLVMDYDTAVPLLDEMLAANRSFLPQFFKD